MSWSPSASVIINCFRLQEILQLNKSLQLPEVRRRCTACVLLVSCAVPHGRAITHTMIHCGYLEVLVHNRKCTAKKGTRIYSGKRRESGEKNTKLLLESHVTDSVSVCVNNNTVGWQHVLRQSVVAPTVAAIMWNLLRGCQVELASFITRAGGSNQRWTPVNIKPKFEWKKKSKTECICCFVPVRCGCFVLFFPHNIYIL